jgi:hypothetical protein
MFISLWAHFPIFKLKGQYSLIHVLTKLASYITAGTPCNMYVSTNYFQNGGLSFIDRIMTSISRIWRQYPGSGRTIPYIMQCPRYGNNIQDDYKVSQMNYHIFCTYIYDDSTRGQFDSILFYYIATVSQIWVLHSWYDSRTWKQCHRYGNSIPKITIVF